MTDPQRIARLESSVRKLVQEASQAPTAEGFRCCVHQATQLQQEIRRLKTGQGQATK